MSSDTLILNTQTRGEIIQKRIECLEWGETPPGIFKKYLH